MLIYIPNDKEMAGQLERLAQEWKMTTTQAAQTILQEYLSRGNHGFPTVRERLEALENGQRNIKARLRKLEHQGSERYGIHYLVEGNDGT